MTASIDDVLTRMRGIDERLAPDDGVRWFNELYLRVTERVAADLDAGAFRAPDVVRRLDAAFADWYFAALEAEPPPAPWAPLLEARHDPDVHPSRFMLVGMNAHINHDLPIALADTCTELNLALEAGTAVHRDFERINALLAEVGRDMLERLRADGIVGRLAGAAALWRVTRARDRAWGVARRLAAWPAADPARAAFLAQLGDAVGARGRGLLRPALG